MSISSLAELPPQITETGATLMLTDIERMVSIVKEIGSETGYVRFIDDYYSYCSAHVIEHGGEVVKYSGDACLAMFSNTDIEAAINCLVAIRDGFADFCHQRGLKPTDIKGVVHVGDVVTGRFGPEGYRDVMGKTVSTLFSMEAPGITLSEQAYRKLPSAKRGPWNKHGGHVVYVMK